MTIDLQYFGGRGGGSKRGKAGGGGSGNTVQRSPQQQARHDILTGNKEVTAKSEKDAVSALNKQLKVESGTGWKVVQDKGGYFGKYTLAETSTHTIGGKTRTRQTGSTQGGFNLVKSGNGTYKVERTGGTGYYGQD